MKLVLNALLFLVLAIFAIAVEQPRNHVIVSYPKGTPSSVLEDAKKAVLEAGGVISHEYHLIQAFAAEVSAKTLETVQSMGAKHNVLIEQDQKMSINSS